MQYDQKTTQAIRESTEHHRDNVHKLKTLEGEFKNKTMLNSFYIGEVEISYDATDCALCKLFNSQTLIGCKDCPLKISGNKCNTGRSLWATLINATTRPEAIKAEERMVEVLENLLPKEEFKVGDRVIIEKCVVNGVEGKVGTIRNIDTSNIPYRVNPDEYTSGGCVWCRKVKKEAPMTQHNTLKSRIEKVTSWNEETDNLLQEIFKPMDCRSPKITVQMNTTTPGDNHSGGSISVSLDRPNEEKTFRFTSQYEKLEAFKKAMMWLLEKSDIPKDIVGKEVEVEYEGKPYKAKITKLL